MDALFWVVWVVLNKFVDLFECAILGCFGCWVVLNKFIDLFGWVILGCLGSVEQICGFIRIRYFGFFGFPWTDSWIYSDAFFWVVLVVLKKFVDLF